MKLTAQQIYEKLINEDRILEIQGQIRFELGDVNIIVKQKDVVGNLIQEWLEGWLKHNGVEFAINTNTQMPPDFFLDPANTKDNLLEVKAFNYKASPGFDIADFNSFQEEIIDKPWMLHVKYLIFGYEMTEDGFVVIKNLWLKSVWEITRRMAQWPLNLQIKDNVVHKIRPGVWYSSKPQSFSMFTTLEEFISAMNETVYQNPKTHQVSGTWLVRFIKSYQDHYGEKLTIPRWNEIEDKFLVEKKK